MRHATSIRVGPIGFRIGSDFAAPIAALRALYADYPKSTIAHFSVRLPASAPWRWLIRPAVAIEGDYMLPDAAPLPLAQGLLAAEMAMNLQVALGHRRHLLLHASCVERDGRALLMTGESGSGKSTLAALLGTRGWRFMGDEFVLIAPESGDAYAFPRAISLKNQAINVAERACPTERFGPRLIATPKGDIRHMVPPADAIARMDEPARPALLLFPTFGEQRDVRPVGAAEAFVRLTQASTNYTALGERGFRTLTDLVERVPARAIDYPDSDSAIALVETLWRDL
ncbi:HprK-related kinase A [Sphingomonas sp. RHCKR47]|uniref:HprK-related kinase A n=1 Tax=Sphingomonas citricola TaxID=2862498 RepID=UPI001CA52A65|nr:HprK-related kinase A [Sphingomonas citricola]MBW6523876.1 HprK-related kinase A [Sphingomonas citricola]